MPERLPSLADLGLTCDIVVAGRALGLGRTKSYELVQRGEFPVRVERIGGRWIVPTAELLRFLGLEPQVGTPAA
ncbi:helix-turn-helix domain-containing protein [Kineococcus sp. SYSU DK001]|uniref:helix-turn-helix domain-containing protein n=1 Tax=Kineococcus sp. SYSU DK001 TaxID=3383122 RepID=UPI003D7DB7D7